MTKHIGNLTVTTQNLHSFPAVDEIYGHLTITAGTELRAPRLALVRGWVTVQTGGVLIAPVLGLVDGWVTMQERSDFSAIHLTEIRADLSIGWDTIIDFPALAIIGSLNLAPDEKKNLLVLKEVRDSVTVLRGSQLQAPLLERIGKSITLREGARLDAPALNYIGGYADIDEGAVLRAPKFIGG